MSGDIVKSVQRAFAILKTVSEYSDGVGVSTIAAKTGLHTSTVSRLITTLESVQVLTRVNGGSQLILGEGLIDLVERAPWTERMIAVARPHLWSLAQETRESVGLTRYSNGRCHVFFQIESPHHIRIRDWTGYDFPLHVTSSGKIWMADWAPSEVNGYFAHQLEQAASKTIVDLNKMKQEIERVRAEGVAWTIDELEDGLISIAVPVDSVDSDQRVAIYLSTPSFRFTKKGDRQRLAELMLNAAERINQVIHAKHQ